VYTDDVPEVRADGAQSLALDLRRALEQLPPAQMEALNLTLGVDYWIEPSIVWQTEFDFELPRAGGTILAFRGAQIAANASAVAPAALAVGCR
jgi:hypothetical protein